MTDSTTETKATQKIHIGNLAPASTEAGVRELFAAQGEVLSYERPLDKVTRAVVGYAFVEMAQADAMNAIAAVNGKQLDGQALRVTEAKPART